MKQKIIGFDADDTLWVNEPYYRKTEKQFAELLSDYSSKETVIKELLKIEIKNIPLYGYGAKGFTLSLLETALLISNYSIPQKSIGEILDLCKDLINQPLVLLEGVEETLRILLSKGFRMLIATKGDLLDQQRKLKNSGLEKYFDHIEIMSDKTGNDYYKLTRRLGIKTENFMMIGNSLKSDILPVVEIGGQAVHIPYHTTWEHEKVEVSDIMKSGYIEIKHISEIVSILENYI
jgi:putative hydrolase of the HAD superfamily